MLLFTIQDQKPDLDRLMTQYGTSLLRLCYMYLKDYQLAQDAVQETFVKVYLKYSLFRAEASEKTWITRISMNVCRDMMRKRAYRERGEEIPEYLAAEPDTGPEADAMERDRAEREAERIAAAARFLPRLDLVINLRLIGLRKFHAVQALINQFFQFFQSVHILRDTSS